MKKIFLLLLVWIPGFAFAQVHDALFGRQIIATERLQLRTGRADSFTVARSMGFPVPSDFNLPTQKSVYDFVQDQKVLVVNGTGTGDSLLRVLSALSWKIRRVLLTGTGPLTITPNHTAERLDYTYALTGAIASPTGGPKYWGTDASNNYGLYALTGSQFSEITEITSGSVNETAMVTVPDNTSGKIVYDIMGWDRVNNRHYILKKYRVYDKISGTLTMGAEAATGEADEITAGTFFSHSTAVVSNNIQFTFVAVADVVDWKIIYRFVNVNGTGGL